MMFLMVQISFIYSRLGNYHWEKVDLQNNFTPLPRIASPAVLIDKYVYQFGGIQYHGGKEGYLNDVVRYNTGTYIAIV